MAISMGIGLHVPTGFSSMMDCAFAFAPDMSTARLEKRRRRNEMMGESTAIK